MARDDPVSEDELEAAAEAIRDQHREIREDLEALGVDLDGRADREPVPDGGE